MMAIVLAGFLAGCGGDNPKEEAAEDARDVAMVERMSKAPLDPVLPAPITANDVARYGLDKPGCSFRKVNQTDPVFIAAGDEGFMTIGGELKRFAGKSTAAQLPGGAYTSYVGLSSTIDLVRQPDAAGAKSDQSHFPARLTVHDAQRRIVFMADGEITCTA
ncbi:hypothetical protein [Novosphingobium sp. Rr 2-17]|uniref:hypothetical protein n=1 Tax=Novosphingobium sp. Rr 2-17 TaxID=555793 RepID=UPI0002F3E183|nr:hypothetical protein [Novosphingobium sp. Rr 2-17]